MHRVSGLGLALILVLLLPTGCAGLHRLETIRDAKKHMLTAAKLEKNREFHEAACEYALVAREYPSSSFYKAAVFKAAILAGHPDNRQGNLNESLHWLHQYQALGLSEKERQGVDFMVLLIKQQRQYQDEIAKIKIDFQALKAVASEHDLEAAAREKQVEAKNEEMRQLQMKIASYEEQIKGQNDRIAQLQSEISKAQDALQQLKNVDLQIHRRRTQ